MERNTIALPLYRQRFICIGASVMNKKHLSNGHTHTHTHTHNTEITWLFCELALLRRLVHINYILKYRTNPTF